MTLIIIIILLVLLFGGGWYGYGRYGYNGLGGVVGLVLIILLIMFVTGNLNVARAQQPVPKVTRTPAPQTMSPMQEPRTRIPVYVSKGFAGATRCEQAGSMITCDNGYTRQVK